jgi:hypothetical protein
MSWWIYGRDRDGKSRVWQVDVDVTMIVMGPTLARRSRRAEPRV